MYINCKKKNISPLILYIIYRKGGVQLSKLAGMVADMGVKKELFLADMEMDKVADMVAGHEC